MKKDFDFDDIGKRTPYRTPEGFFEDVQRKVMERAGLKQQRKSHTKLIISTVVAIAAVLAGILFVPSLRQMDEVKSSSSNTLAVDRSNGTDPVLSLIHISEPTRQAEISYAVFCLKKKKNNQTQ